jgi:cytochrome P450
MTNNPSLPIEELDVSSPTLFQLDEWSSPFRRLRHEKPVHYCASSPYGPYWAITRFEDIQAIELDHHSFSSDSARGGIRIDNRLRESFISSDPPRHTIERKTIAPVASPSNLAGYEINIRKRTKNLLANLPRNETFDWVKTVSSELTVMMLATLFEFPFEERAKLAHWSDAFICDYAAPDAIVRTDEDRLALLQQMATSFRSLWNERLSREPKLDLISMMAHNPAMSKMSDSQYLGNLVLLLVGGYDTTKNSMTGGLLALSQNPDQWIKLKDNPALITSMIGEIIRYQTPIIHMCRTATRDVKFKEQMIRKDDRVVLWYISANRDETAIESPEEFIIDRPKPHKHLSFGAGIHRCVGDRLANLQLRILWEEILEHKLNVEVVGPPIRQYSNFIRGVCHLPVCIHG